MSSRLLGAALRLGQAVQLARRHGQGTLAQRQQAIVRWCGEVLGDLGLAVAAPVATPPQAPMLIVANHVSWLDSLLIGAHLPCCYVAKRELWSWPLVGPLLTASGAVPVERMSPEGLAAAVETCTQRLREGYSVCVFPEGTTTDGTRLLPFQRAFFECAVAADVPVLVAALSYRRDERPCTGMAWRDESFWASARRIVAQAPGVVAGLRLEPLGPPAGRGRQVLAETAQAVLSTLLGLEPPQAGPAAAPQSGLLQLIASAAQQQGAAPDLATLEHRTWGELGLDSLDAMALLLAVEQHLGRPIPDAQLALFGTDRTIRELMQAVLGPPPLGTVPPSC